MTHSLLCSIIAATGISPTRSQLYRIVYLLGYCSDWRLGPRGPYSRKLCDALEELVAAGGVDESVGSWTYTLTPSGRAIAVDIIDSLWTAQLAAAPPEILELAARIHWQAEPKLAKAQALLRGQIL